MRVMVFRRFLAGAELLDLEALRGLCSEAVGPVGSCSCGGYLFVDCPVQQWRRDGPVWAQLVCRSCGHETACPDGRLAPYRKDQAAAS